MDIKEKSWISIYNSFNSNYGYNNTEGGDGCLGLKRELNPNKRKVIQFELDGKYIKEWECIADASEQLKIAHSTIVSCCRNKNKSAGGYIWKYIENCLIKEKTLPYKKESKCIPIIQLTLEGVYIKEFKSCREASKLLNISSAQINGCCKMKKKRKSAGGFLWLYKQNYIDNKKYDICTIREKGGKKCVKIVQMDLQYNLIQTFNSISEAATQLRINASHITSCCTKNRNKCGGYKWMYYNEYIKQQEQIHNENNDSNKENTYNQAS